MNDAKQEYTEAGFSPAFLEVIRNLVAYFTLRQHLVMLAMLDLNPRALDQELFGIDTRPYRNNFTYRFKSVPRDAQTKIEVIPPIPLWKSEWEYFPHGAGCKLTHVRTGEPIEWDAPNPHAFRIDWFRNHLAWRLRQESEDPFVKLCLGWLEDRHASLEVVEKAIYWLIAQGVLKLLSNHTCVLKVKHTRPKATAPLSKEVVAAAHNAMAYYHQRQQYAIQAMIELRPDFILQIANDPYQLPEIAQRLRALCQHLPTPPVPGPKNQVGIWNNIWDYTIGYATCSLTNSSTQEPIWWATADPNTLDFHGFTQHLQWRIVTGQLDSSLELLVQWMRENVTEIYRLLDKLIADDIIVLVRNEKSVLVKFFPSDRQATLNE